jgi:transposase-like protein
MDTKRKVLKNVLDELGLKSHKLDQSDIQEMFNDAERKNFEFEKDKQEKEEQRINKIECPSCQSTNKKHIVKRNNNGVFGPGFSSWITDEYFVCKDCGTRFEDLTKI